MDNVQFPQVPIPEGQRPSVKVEGKILSITMGKTTRRFEVTDENNLPVTDPKEIEKIVKSILEKFSDFPLHGQEAGKKEVISISYDSENKVHFKNITNVKRKTLHEEVKSVEGKTDTEAIEKIKNEIKQKFLKSKENPNGFSERALEMALGSILDGINPLEAFHDESDWNDRPIVHILHEPGNENIQKALIELRGEEKKGTRVSSKALKREANTLKAQLQIYLMETMVRSPRSLKMEKGRSAIHEVAQGVDGNVTGIGKEKSQKGKSFLETLFRRNKGYSSAGDKKGVLKPHSVNLRSVTIRDVDGPKEVCVLASGKMESTERLQEGVIHACIEQLATSNPKGFTTNEKGELEFQHVITSYLDPSRVKSFGVRFTGSTGLDRFRNIFRTTPIGDERTYLKQMTESLDKWPPEGYEFTLPDGKTKVRLKKPILANQLFSGFVRGVPGVELGQEASDRLNFAANHQFFTDFVKKNNISSPSLTKAEKKLADKMTEYFPKRTYIKKDGTIDFSRIPLSALMDPKSKPFFETKEYKEYQKEVINLLIQQLDLTKNSPDQIITTSLLIYLLLGKIVDLSLGEKTQVKDAFFSLSKEDRAHIVDMEIVRNNFMTAMEYSSGVQCKSGTDRTGLGIALALAQNEFAQTHGFPYMRGDRKVDEEFSEVYKKYLNEFGFAMTSETKGVVGLKIETNPVPLALLPKTDVVGETEKKYSGKLREKRQIAGQSVQTEKKEKYQYNSKLVMGNVNGILGNGAIDEKLQLQMPISELGLDDSKVFMIRRKIAEMETNEALNDTQKVEIYILKKVLSIYTEIEKAKTAEKLSLTDDQKVQQIEKSIKKLTQKK